MMQIVDNGTPYEIKLISGIVLGADQRSDTYVSGGGSVNVYNGTGGGSSWVSSEVIVTKDIFLRDANGKEHHVRLDQDIPLRPGQCISISVIESRGLRKPHRFYFSLINHSTDDVYWLLTEAIYYKPRPIGLIGFYLAMAALTVLLVYVAPVWIIAAVSVYIWTWRAAFTKRKRLRAAHRQVVAESNKDYEQLKIVYGQPKPVISIDNTSAA